MYVLSMKGGSSTTIPGGKESTARPSQESEYGEGLRVSESFIADCTTYLLDLSIVVG